jgi:hypothetical protein
MIATVSTLSFTFTAQLGEWINTDGDASGAPHLLDTLEKSSSWRSDGPMVLAAGARTITRGCGN